MSGKKALVTGGTRGIGRATARALREEGFEVTVTGTKAGAAVLRGCRYMPVDLSSRRALEEFSEAVSRMGFSVLVNNAGINKVGSIEKVDPADYDRIQEVNVRAPYLLCRAVIPGMRKRRFGRIVNVSSILAVVSRPGRSAYSTSKSALVGLTRALALEGAADNVLVNCISPGFVDTDLTRRILGTKGLRRAAAHVPAGRVAQPMEIARFIRFLSSSDNTYMTGQNIVVDGGFTCA